MSNKIRKNNILATGVIAGIVLFAPFAAAPAMAVQASLDPISKTVAQKSSTKTTPKFTAKRDAKHSKSFHIDGEFTDHEALLQDSLTEAYIQYRDFFDSELLEDDPLDPNWKEFDAFEDPFQDIYPDEYLSSSHE